MVNEKKKVTEIFNKIKSKYKMDFDLSQKREILDVIHSQTCSLNDKIVYQGIFGVFSYILVTQRYFSSIKEFEDAAKIVLNHNIKYLNTLGLTEIYEHLKEREV